jgi:hypothetical protein
MAKVLVTHDLTPLARLIADVVGAEPIEDKHCPPDGALYIFDPDQIFLDPPPLIPDRRFTDG